MDNNQTAAASLFLWSWAILALAHLLPSPSRQFGAAVAVLLAVAAFTVALLVAVEESERNKQR